MARCAASTEQRQMIINKHRINLTAAPSEPYIAQRKLLPQIAPSVSAHHHFCGEIASESSFPIASIFPPSLLSDFNGVRNFQLASISKALNQSHVTVDSKNGRKNLLRTCVRI